MNQIFKELKESSKFFILSTSIIIVFLLIAVVYKNDNEISNIGKNTFDQQQSIQKIKSPFVNANYEVKKGDTIQKILKKFNIENKEIYEAIKQYKKYAPANSLFQGSKIDILIKENFHKKNNSLLKLSIPISKSISVEISRDELNEIVSKKIITKLYKKKILSENIIKNSLYSSATKAKINPDTIIEFARIFGFEIDFQRDIRKNDYFRIVYDKYFDEKGKFIKSGSIHYAYMSVNGREIILYKFGDNKDYGYYDVNGNSVEKALMKTPINGARLSSSFGLRKHPILGFNKMHKGTDFAAPSGTPIMASGSGTIIRSRWCGGGGNCVKIKHNSTYQTIYAHMKSFAKGIKEGRKVRQGQIIGYVGSTGMSTGPHLHYEVMINGKQVNSQKLKLPSGKILKGDERKLFEIYRIKTDVLVAEMSNR